MPSRGRVRGLLAVWAETRMKRERIWTSANTTLGHGRRATLALLSELVAQNTIRMPGPRNPHPMGRVLANINSDNIDPFPSMCIARARNSGPCPCVEPSLHLPYYKWPQCLCRCRCPLNVPPHPPSSESETDSTSTSGPPSLESITDLQPPESGVEGSGSASNSKSLVLCFVTLLHHLGRIVFF